MTLDEYISDRLDMPFVWGQHDCVLFAIGWLNIRTGKNWIAAIPPWSTAKEGLRIVKQLGGLQAEFDRRLKPVSSGIAVDGDLTIFNRSVFLFSGRHIVGPGLTCLQFTDRTKATCAWSC